MHVQIPIHCTVYTYHDHVISNMDLRIVENETGDSILGSKPWLIYHELSILF